eukprot:12212621-Alexandrium_andersonii.AAC.1
MANLSASAAKRPQAPKQGPWAMGRRIGSAGPSATAMAASQIAPPERMARSIEAAEPRAWQAPA